MSLIVLARNTGYAFGENRLTLAAAIILALLVLCALFGPSLAPYDPLTTAAAAKLAPPSAHHLFGTDALGRDILSRVIVATRLDLGMAVSAVALSFVVGLALGAAAGYFGGWTDAVVGRVMDTILAFPLFVLAMGIVVALGNSVLNIIIATMIINLPFYCRFARSAVNVRRDLGYVEAARMGGNGSLMGLINHIIPNILPPMMVQASLNMGWAILNAAGLSFIGLGVRRRTPEWGIIFQSPRTALNPIRKVGKQIEDVLLEHANLPRRDLKRAAIAALARVRIPDPERRAEAYPFELSGGMCQRVMIAMALACTPSVLIADEPTTGLDVTTQAVIMDLIRDMSRDARMSTLLITHDLGLAGEYCDRIAVMHAGHIVEIAETETLLDHPAHPYTRQLLAATPVPDSRLDTLTSIPGQLPDLRSALPPCRFSGRCERRQPICDEGELPWMQLSPAHSVRCRFPL